MKSSSTATREQPQLIITKEKPEEQQRSSTAKSINTNFLIKNKDYLKKKERTLQIRIILGSLNNVIAKIVFPLEWMIFAGHRLVLLILSPICRVDVSQVDERAWFPFCFTMHGKMELGAYNEWSRNQRTKMHWNG